MGVLRASGAKDRTLLDFGDMECAKRWQSAVLRIGLYCYPGARASGFFLGCLSGLGGLSSSGGVLLFSVLGFLFFFDLDVLFSEILVPAVAVGGDGDELAVGGLVVDIGGLFCSDAVAALVPMSAIGDDVDCGCEGAEVDFDEFFFVSIAASGLYAALGDFHDGSNGRAWLYGEGLHI